MEHLALSKRPIEGQLWHYPLQRPSPSLAAVWPGDRGLVGERELQAMKPSAILVNTSRGPIVDEGALVQALAAGRIRAAALDVYDVEPLPPDSALLNCPGLTLTPHLGFVTEKMYKLFYTDAVEDIAAFMAGSPVRLVT